MIIANKSRTYKIDSRSECHNHQSHRPSVVNFWSSNQGNLATCKPLQAHTVQWSNHTSCSNYIEDLICHWYTNKAIPHKVIPLLPNVKALNIIIRIRLIWSIYNSSWITIWKNMLTSSSAQWELTEFLYSSIAPKGTL